MSIPTLFFPTDKLVRMGLRVSDHIHYQLSPEELHHQILERGQGEESSTGATVIQTGTFTGRSPRDKFIVRDTIAQHSVHWNEFNLPIEEKYFDEIFAQVTDYFNTLPEYWVRDSFACADERYRLSIRTISEKPWTDLFIHNMFIRPTEDQLDAFHAQWHIFCAPDLKLDPAVCGTRQSNAAVVSFRHKMILIAGTGYTGETKKGIFTVLNYLLPQQEQVLSMHCSANRDASGETALYFGLSGTGKTTLSADPTRQLIGDDEHGWTDSGIFNFEGGCYAKCIHLTEEKEPDIFRAIRPGALLENVRFFPGTRDVNYDDAGITENTRVSYPLHYIPNTVIPSVGNHPRHIFFLTCDAYGVLPPISRLTPAQAMYQFISGYTAKVAGTETGVTEPKATFSACFGAPFLPLHPGVYASLLGERLRMHDVHVWLVNTGWTGGPYGTGHRISLKYTRAMIRAALAGKLDHVETYRHPVFGMQVPLEVPGVPDEVLNPRNTWADAAAYDEAAIRLAQLFRQNFEKYKDGVEDEILMAAPQV